MVEINRNSSLRRICSVRDCVKVLFTSENYLKRPITWFILAMSNPVGRVKRYSKVTGLLSPSSRKSAFLCYNVSQVSSGFVFEESQTRNNHYLHKYSSCLSEFLSVTNLHSQ